MEPTHADNKATTRQEVEEMGYTSTGDLEPTENFYLSEKGITFYYNIYEIAPYVMGPVEITLPYEIMSHLLSDEKGVLIMKFLNYQILILCRFIIPLAINN